MYTLLPSLKTTLNTSDQQAIRPNKCRLQLMLVSGLIAGSSFEDDDVVVAGGGGEAGGGAFQPIQAGEKVGLARYQVSQVAGGQPEAE